MSRPFISEKWFEINNKIDPVDSFHLFYTRNINNHIRPKRYVRCLKTYLKFVARKDEKFITNLFFKNSESTQNAYPTFWDKILGNFETKMITIITIRNIKNSHKYNPNWMIDLDIPMKDAKYFDSVKNPYYKEPEYDPNGIVEEINE